MEPENHPFEKENIFQAFIFGFHVKFRGCASDLTFFFWPTKFAKNLGGWKNVTSGMQSYVGDRDEYTKTICSLN